MFLCFVLFSVVPCFFLRKKLEHHFKGLPNASIETSRCCAYSAHTPFGWSGQGCGYVSDKMRALASQACQPSALTFVLLPLPILCFMIFFESRADVAHVVLTPPLFTCVLLICWINSAFWVIAHVFVFCFVLFYVAPCFLRKKLEHHFEGLPNASIETSRCCAYCAHTPFGWSGQGYGYVSGKMWALPPQAWMLCILCQQPLCVSVCCWFVEFILICEFLLMSLCLFSFLLLLVVAKETWASFCRFAGCKHRNL